MKQLTRIIAPVMVAAVVVTGCGGSATKDNNGGAKDQPTVQADPNKPVQGGVYTKSLNYGDPGNLDPIMKSDVAAQMVTMQIFDTLVKYDPVKKEIVKDLAEDYKVSDDGLTYTFKLKKGVLFHNGRELKAADVKYTMERASNTKLAPVTLKMFDKVVGYDEFQKGAAEISGIKVSGDSDLTITLKEPKATFLMDLGSVAAGIVPKEEAEKPDFGQHPVGSGPFKLAEWKKDDKVTLAANDKYFAGRPYLDQVVFRIMKEEATRDAEFQSGTLDSMVIGEALYKRYSADPEKKKGLVEVPELFTRAIHFNTTKAPFDNVKVRQAINYAVDKGPIVQKVLNNKAFVATGVLPASSPAYDPSLKGYEFNQEKARQLLKEAGIDKLEFEVNVTSSTAPWAEAINIDLNKVGINMKINQMESSTLLDKSRKGDYQACIFSTGGDADPISFLGRFDSKNAGAAGNVTLFKNDQVDKILADASKVTDMNKRVELARQAEKIIVENTPWFIFNYNKAVLITQPWVHGLQQVPTDIDFQDLSKVWVSKKK
jgi:peptide/nickel transport system substrate-binding protein